MTARSILSLLALCALSATAQQPEDGPVFGFTGHTLFADEALERGLFGGVLVNAVPVRSTAYEAGLQRNDVIVEAESTSVHSMEQLGAIFTQVGVGAEVECTVLRGDELLRLRWRIMSNFEQMQGMGAPLPPLRMDAWVGEPVTRETLAGKVAVLVFWWNGLENSDGVVQMCRDWHTALAAKDVVVVPLHVIFRDFALNPAEAAETYLRDLGLPFASGNASGARFAREGDEISPPLVVTDFNLMSVPTVIITNREGLMVGYAMYNGQPDFSAEMQTAIEALADEEGPVPPPGPPGQD